MLVRTNSSTDAFKRGLLIFTETRAGAFALFPDVDGTNVSFYACVTVLVVLKDEGVVTGVTEREHTSPAIGHGFGVNDCREGTACFPGEP